jgi:hypothetical protein
MSSPDGFDAANPHVLGTGSLPVNLLFDDSHRHARWYSLRNDGSAQRTTFDYSPSPSPDFAALIFSSARSSTCLARSPQKPSALPTSALERPSG